MTGRETIFWSRTIANEYGGPSDSWPRWAIRRVMFWNATRPWSVKSKVTFGWLFWSKFCSGLVMSSPLSCGLSLRTK